MTFTPAAVSQGLSGHAGFDYTVVDGYGGISSASVIFNHPPVAADDAHATNSALLTATPGVSLTGLGAILVANDTDADGDELTVAAIGSEVLTTASGVTVFDENDPGDQTMPAGEVTLGDDGSLTFAPAGFLQRSGKLHLHR